MTAGHGHRTYLATFPREFSHQAALNFVRSLAALPFPALDLPVQAAVWEIYGNRQGIKHYLSIPRQVNEPVDTHLMTHIPGASIARAERPSHRWAFAVDLALTHPHRLLRIGNPDALAATLLSAFGALADDQAVLLQWVIAPARARLLPPQRSQRHGSLLLPGVEAEVRKERRQKQNDHTFLAACRIAATGSDARRLVGRVHRALDSCRAPGVRFRRRWTGVARVCQAVRQRQIPAMFACHLNATELTPLLGLPFGTPNVPGLPQGRSRHLYADSNIPESGIAIAESTYPGVKRILALRPEDLLMHTHIHGKNGVGKSNVIIHLSVRQMEMGYGVGIIDPAGDLVDDVLARIPRQRLSDVVVFEPAAATEAGYAVGFNILAGTDNPEVLADQMMAIFHGIYRDTGIYANNYLRGAIQALASVAGMTLVDVPVFLLDAGFRSRVVAQVEDPVIRDVWVRFGQKSASEQRTLVLPAIHRIQPLLMRSSVRLSLGQSQNQIDMARVLKENKILLVSLPKGRIGEATAVLYGSIFFARIWQAAQARARDERQPFFLHIDEAHNFIHMPLSLDTVLAEARKFKLGLALAHQGESQMPMSIREAIHTNTRTKIAFNVSASDAVSVAKEIGPPLVPTDLTTLGRYEMVLQAVTHNRTSAPATGRTLAPLPENKTPTAEEVRMASRRRWARKKDEIDAEILARQRSGKLPTIEFEDGA